MRRTILATSTAVATFLAAGSASAQSSTDFAAQGQFIVSVERLLPLFSYQNRSTSPSDNSGTSQSVTNIALVTSNPHHVTYYNVPRVAVDYTIIPNLTLGGSVFVAFDLGSDNEVEVNGVENSTDGPRITYWGITPRVGYNIRFSDMFSFWPRAGVSYISHKQTVTNVLPNGQTQDESTSLNQLAIAVEPMFVFTPFNHVGVFGGPLVDIPLTGSAVAKIEQQGTTRSTSIDASQFHFGLTAGLLAYF